MMQSINLHRVHTSGDKTIRCKLFLMEADVKTQTDSQPLHMACKKKKTGLAASFVLLAQWHDELSAGC